MLTLPLRRGVQRFHLYDFEASPKLANILARYMEAGIVDLHTITFEGAFKLLFAPAKLL